MNLFRSGDFTLASGKRSSVKIDCDALVDADWATLAAMVVPALPPFGSVEGVPTGGLKFADALRPYATPFRRAVLIADDVCTTGESLERQRAGRAAVGIVVFARGPVPAWIRAAFTLTTGG